MIYFIEERKLAATGLEAKNWMEVYDFVSNVISQMSEYYSSAHNVLAPCPCFYIPCDVPNTLRFLIFCTEKC